MWSSWLWWIRIKGTQIQIRYDDQDLDQDAVGAGGAGE